LSCSWLLLPDGTGRLDEDQPGTSSGLPSEVFHHEVQLEVTEEAGTRDQVDLAQLPCPGEQLQIDDTYSFIADDVLNGKSKDGHFGLLISNTMQTLSGLTEGFTSTNKLISLTRDSCNEITQNTGQTCLDIMTKYDDGEHLSHREMHFLKNNRGVAETLRFFHHTRSEIHRRF